MQNKKHEIPNSGNVETTQKWLAEIPATECQQNHFPAMGKMKNIAKTSIQNAQELQKRGEDKDVNAKGNGYHFWVITCPRSQKLFSQKWVLPQIQISDSHTLPILMQ